MIHSIQTGTNTLVEKKNYNHIKINHTCVPKIIKFTHQIKITFNAKHLGILHNTTTDTAILPHPFKNITFLLYHT